MKKLPAFTKGDGAHRGPADWYKPQRRSLAAALGRCAPFDTGWYGVKHEIMSARVYSATGAGVAVEVSVSDNFDTPGTGGATVVFGAGMGTLGAVEAALEDAARRAYSDQEDNRQYCGFSLMQHRAGVDGQPTERCIEYLILPRDGDYTIPPTGDTYTDWGWQGPTRCPPKVLQVLTAHAAREGTALRIGQWEVRPWSLPSWE